MNQRFRFMMAGVIALASCGQGSSQDSPGGPDRDGGQVSRGSLPAPTPNSSLPANTKAQTYAKSLRVRPGVTSFERFFAQMPSDAVPQIGLEGRVRSYTFTFPDGSRLIARFTTAGGEGSGQGLTLQEIDTP